MQMRIPIAHGRVCLLVSCACVLALFACSDPSAMAQLLTSVWAMYSDAISTDARTEVNPQFLDAMAAHAKLQVRSCFFFGMVFVGWVGGGGVGGGAGRHACVTLFPSPSRATPLRTPCTLRTPCMPVHALRAVRVFRGTAARAMQARLAKFTSLLVTVNTALASGSIATAGGPDVDVDGAWVAFRLLLQDVGHFRQTMAEALALSKLAHRVDEC
jgi:hypothetical protein